jgi:hypothetical protein
MASTVIRGAQIKDSTVQRHDLDTSTVGQAVVTKVVQGSGITLSSTGADSGTGDVTVAASAIPLASSAQSGLLNQTSGNTTDFIDGTNNSQPLAPAVQPTIWSVRLRSFNSAGNSTFEVDSRMSGGSNIASGAFAQDRWQFYSAGATMKFYGGPSAMGSSPVDLPGTSFRITNRFLISQVTTQQVSLAAGDYAVFMQAIEGPSMRELADDVHSISLLVRSTVAGLKFGIGLRDNAATRTLTKLCTIPSANTWTLIQLPNLPVWASGGTYGTTPGTVGYQLHICLAAGTTFTAPANDTWQNGNFFGALGQDNFASKPVNSEVDIAFIQHEPGAQCSTLIDCPFTKNYDDCLRYYCKSYDYGDKAGTVTSLTGASAFTGADGWGSVAGGLRFPKPMAKLPVATIYNPVNGAVNSASDGGTNYSTTGGACKQTGIASFTITPSLGAASGGVPLYFHYTADTGW